MFSITPAGRIHAGSASVKSVQPLGNTDMRLAVFISHTWVPLQQRRFVGSKWAVLPIFGLRLARRSIKVATTGVQQSAHAEPYAEPFAMDRFRFPRSLLNQGRQSMEQALSSSNSIVYLVRSYGRASSFRRMTCGLLEKLLPLNSCRLVLAADDPDMDIYKTNSGPWEDRIIMGVRGAERQIAFIDQISRPGTGLGCI